MLFYANINLVKAHCVTFASISIIKPQIDENIHQKPFASSMFGREFIFLNLKLLSLISFWHN